MSFLKLENVCKTYQNGNIIVNAVNNISFELNDGEFVIILGSSGAGKTTLLNLLGGMEKATSGNIYLEDKNVTSLNRKGLCEYRRNDVGFVFQFYNLMPNLSSLENVEIAIEICKNHLDPKQTLIDVGLGDRLNNFPSQLSGGEQQRVSIARAIAKKPKLLLCDEPTGALDYKTGKQILKLLEETCRKENMTVIIITHNTLIAPMADKIIKFRNGQVEEVVINDNPTPVEEIEW